MNAKQTRQQHITKVEAEIKRLTAAVQMLKANTAEDTAWDWTYDWDYLAQLMNEVTDVAEGKALISQGERKAMTDTSTAAATLGRKGGQSTSEAKRAAVRENGKKGGRPRKSPANKPQD